MVWNTSQETPEVTSPTGVPSLKVTKKDFTSNERWDSRYLFKAYDYYRLHNEEGLL